MAAAQTESIVDRNISKAQTLKEEGNALFKAGDAAKALSKYTKIFAYVNGLKAPPGEASFAAGALPTLSAEQSAAITELQISAANNATACHVKLKSWPQAIKFATQALAIEKNNAKALFRRGVAHEAMGAIDAAVTDLEAALKLSPTDAAIIKALSVVKAKDATAQRESDAKLKAGLSKMFG